VGLKLIFLIVSRAVSLLGLSRREAWWKDAEILMLRHQLAVAGRERPGARARLTWPDRALLALLAGTLPIDHLAAMRLIATPGTILTRHASDQVAAPGRARPLPRMTVDHRLVSFDIFLQPVELECRCCMPSRGPGPGTNDG
jgi:hypothetical protein